MMADRREYYKGWHKRNRAHEKAYRDTAFKEDPEGVRYDAKERQKLWRERKKEKAKIDV